MRVVGVGLVALAGLATGAAATTINVNANGDLLVDNGNCTLREAVIAANTDAPRDACAAGNAADVINVPAGTYQLTIAGAVDDAAATGDLDLTDDVEIVGAGAATTIIDAGDLDRVIDVDPGATGIDVTLRALAITDGMQFEGGGIRNQGILRLEEVEVTDNTAFSPMGARGGGISSTGQLTIVDSVFSFNIVDTGPMAFGPGVIARGGGIFSSGTLDISNSTIRQNGATTASGSAVGGGIHSFGPVTISGSAIMQNGAVTAFFSIFSTGAAAAGGVYAGSSASIVNSTVSGNEAFLGGGPGGFAAGLFLDDATLANVTITENDAPTADALFVSTARQVTVRNSIVDGTCQVNGTIVANAYNLAADSSCGFSGTDLVGVDPMLGPLQDNGGPTLTHALATGSPALEAGNPADPGSIPQACSIEDQRGVARPQRLRCDIGAYESNDGIPDAFKCYKAGDLRDPPFAPVTLGLDDQLASQTDVAARKPYLVCNPADMGTGVQNSVDHLACYKIRADRLDPPVDLEVSDVFGTTRLQISKPKALCVRSAKQVLP